VSLPPLRILILSTPKTGNTWLRNLLSVAYRLPQLTLTAWPFDPHVFRREGDRWVTHHHYPWTPGLANWIQENRVIVVSTVRHPADTLISMYHHIHRFKNRSADIEFLRHMMVRDFARTDIIPEQVGRPFWSDLSCSIGWAQAGFTHVVRYERLRRNTRATLQELTSGIWPVTAARLEAAVQACDITLMRRLAGPFGGFFREGRVGTWRTILPPDIIDCFKYVEPYRSQLSALGYSMEPDEDVICPTAESPGKSPLAYVRQFDNGVRVSPILVKCFLHAEDDLRARWSDHLSGTGPQSFFRWLTESGESNPGLSNLTAFVHFDRYDLRRAFPDIAGSSRGDFQRWFTSYAQSEYGLDEVFIRPVRRDLEHSQSDRVA
jgi:hypothetical protein